jgi:uncharacterized protein YbjT (DUF2867 family)
LELSLFVTHCAKKRQLICTLKIKVSKIILINIKIKSVLCRIRTHNVFLKERGIKLNILILGAAGQISRLVTKKVLEETDNSLTLFARNVSGRILVTDPAREKVIDGDFKDKSLVKEALKGIDLVYLNDMNDEKGIQTVVEAMEEVGVKKLIVASILGIYDEVQGAFGKWNERMVGRAGINLHKRTAAIVENSNLDYTILRLTWLYNQKGNNAYQLTQKGAPFQGAQVTREAVAQLILDVIEEPEKFVKKSLGVGEPNTNWANPSFY